ncbi:MAG: hypothetical protein UR25_C0003G0008 [Candidatus Nomurabacteria bacterium GW2011_GWE1_32_28]|uniref:Uncharacterized protein n=1 Tax=Candidatus Nomurabacteria bacterium GW2011_GWF1_31_48 TaxID=1618767 RepID=A0A0G0AUC3_9BACT|nr:MAG: hypothetical protein UR10_C0003G0008 [Candidatus Nomurabacteria bacterium GW2011_GWF2_30_133]KKP28648.1 MAG: hypothetical protein UR18_C0002G0060 [Candidatus Nomurabacteria bacterium GW2011_GWE2_31_40]KKP30225.1 MAG: hypothetical protein UR19_C0003G0061 [Candidatus Nomurabacteria bacterium GW2011_GWF1_31_48]KKP34752.1 MAG: hypothetical protein UR25_C0003G0008 [Candidatus Nomurabacteria bacterium GW2011_GWE1_32_28]MCE9585638.1 hypothetical protein [Candidatus Nomurabacteria bacterium]
MNNENTEPVKSVSGSLIILWLLGVSVAIMGIAGGSITVILAGIILLPITNTLIKKYLKINLSSMARVVIAVLLIVVGSIASSSLDEAREKVSENSSIDTVSQEEVYSEIASFSGKGNQDTGSFSVTGKKVRITATTCCGSSSSGTYSGVSLKKENDGYTGPGLSISTEGSEKGQGQTTYRNLTPGQYYIQVITGVNWEVKVEQVN